MFLNPGVLLTKILHNKGFWNLEAKTCAVPFQTDSQKIELVGSRYCSMVAMCGKSGMALIARPHPSPFFFFSPLIYLRRSGPQPSTASSMIRRRRLLHPRSPVPHDSPPGRQGGALLASQALLPDHPAITNGRPAVVARYYDAAAAAAALSALVCANSCVSCNRHHSTDLAAPCPCPDHDLQPNEFTMKVCAEFMRLVTQLLPTFVKDFFFSYREEIFS